MTLVPKNYVNRMTTGMRTIKLELQPHVYFVLGDILQNL